jgi:hypothetical protein
MGKTQLEGKGDVFHACFAVTSKAALYIFGSRGHLIVRGCSFDMYRSIVGTKSSTLYQSLNEVRHAHYVNQRMAEVK